MSTATLPCVLLNEFGNLAAQDYHETLWEGFSAWWDKLTDQALQRGWGVPEISKEDISVQPMSYETSQRFHVLYVPEVMSKKAGHAMAISIYRLPSGRYEFTCYNS